ncbi:unnamed protein product [Bursaphelenchus okinawaensis]|uniref:BPI2 domain-containing protein n=1 Tax=Bursaphelenchus okinawaensis TaxID=465554 RepID=A0A811KY30_9BILA|nr:unnamed protein product [Bursaphelenchus okinawaensis]CAG9112886.1 unnamed protein product [Bursaphelenchus okinawaensis]
MIGLLWPFLLLAIHASGSDLGFSVGSNAASQLAQHAVHSVLQQPRKLQIEMRNSANPWFEPIAHLNTNARVLVDDIKIRFHSSMVDLKMHNLSMKSHTEVVVLPLPFFLGEDVAHVSAQVPLTDLQFKVHDMSVAMEFCQVEEVNLDVFMERGYFLNWVLKPVTGLIPASLLRDYVCTTLSDHLGQLRNRFAVEFPLISLVPPKFQQYLHSKNTTLRIHLISIEADKEQLTLSAGVDWAEASMPEDIQTSQTTKNPNQKQDSAEDSEEDTQLLKALTITDSENDAVDRNLQLWVQDRLVNEVMEKFDWDFEWMNEDIAVNSDKLPRSTRDFLAVLCPTCFFELRVNANGVPHVQSSNSSMILKKSDRIFIKVVNPTTNTDSVFVSLYLTLTIQLMPEVNDGIFRTQVNLLSTDIRMEEGAFPSAWNEFVQDLVKGMIMDVIWPGLKTEIEALIYSDGLKIPSNCGLEPTSMKLIFDDGKLGISSRLLLDELYLKECLKQVKSKLPDPSKLLVIKDM